MIVYRLCKAAHIALDGEGARLWGGRWNSPGRPMVYCAASPSLAVLEVLVHLDLPSDLLPDDYRLITISIPDDAPVQVHNDVVDDGNACRGAGDSFLTAGEALAMSVSSIVVPQERNWLLNPRHTYMERVSALKVEPFSIDPRLAG